jgi:rubredoxin
VKKNVDPVVKVFKDAKVRWVCRNCGYVHEGPEALKVCPACDHPQAYFELEASITNKENLMVRRLKILNYYRRRCDYIRLS